MKLYGITYEQAATALREEKQAGRIAPHVHFKLIREFTPRGGGIATEVQLEAYERDRGRRYGNAGSYGAGSDYAATYDEWGWFLQHLYDETPTMLAGSPAYPAYKDREDYIAKTGMSYVPDLAERLARTGDPYPYVAGRRCIGRRGAGRLSGSDPRSQYWGKPDPRTPEWARDFRAGQVY
jgi:hypothetical protein